MARTYTLVLTVDDTGFPDEPMSARYVIIRPDGQTSATGAYPLTSDADGVAENTMRRFKEEFYSHERRKV